MAEFQLDYVLDKFSPREMEDALQTLPVTLVHAYNLVMQRLEKRKSGVKQLALKSLFWILNAGRPLRTAELCELLVVRSGDKEIQEHHRLHPQSIIDACESLVVCDKSEFIRFTHFTVQEFLRDYTAITDLNLLQDLAITCISYLGFDRLELASAARAASSLSASGMELASDRFLTSPLEYQALRYVLRWWSFHASQAEWLPEVQVGILSLLRSERWTRVREMTTQYANDILYSWKFPYYDHGADQFTGHYRVWLSEFLFMNAFSLDALPDPSLSPLLYILAALGLAKTCIRLLWGDQNASKRYVLCT
jgi:hypothetical protein